MKQIMKTFLALVVISIVGCENDPQMMTMERRRTLQMERQQNIRYFRDERTDTCFAYILLMGGPIITSVSCQSISVTLLRLPPVEMLNDPRGD